VTTIPLRSVAIRAGAVASSEMVALLDGSATKVNTKNDPDAAGAGLDLETVLKVRAWVREVGDVKHTWVDLHVFDKHDEVIGSNTLPLHYLGDADDGDEYGFEGSVFRGTGASPGSVWLEPDARKVQYRLYYEAEGTVFTDGLLRQLDLAPDSEVTNPHAVTRVAGQQPGFAGDDDQLGRDSGPQA
jgi:hypothetical protein